MIKLTDILPQSNTKINQLHLAATMLFLALFAFPLYPVHLANVLLMVLAALTLTALFIKPIPVGKTILRNLIFVLPFIPYLVEFCITGFDPIARFEFEKKLFFFTAIFIIPVFIDVTGFRNYKLALLVFSLSVSALCLYSFAALLIMGIPFHASAYENGSYILRHNFEVLSGLQSTYYSIFALSAACFLFNASFLDKKKLRITCNIISAILLISVFYLAVRIAFLTVGVIFLIWIACSKKVLWKKIFLGLATVAVLIAVSFVVPSLKSRLSEFVWLEEGPMDNANTISQRTMIMNCSMKVFSENIFTGTGSAHFQQKLSDCYTSHDWQQGAAVNFNPHNQYLSLGINYGLIMLIVFIVCLFMIFRKVFKFSEGKYFGIAIILFFLTESMLEREMGVYFFGLIALLLYNMKPEPINRISNL